MAPKRSSATSRSAGSAPWRCDVDQLLDGPLAGVVARSAASEIDTYWLRAWCFWRVAVLMAVMIWRVMQRSAKARKRAWCSGRKSRAAL